jgi:putative ABC transport system permease protein
MIFLFIFIIVFVIVVMGIINTMSMSVMERTREIGTLRALGMQRLGIMRLFSTEGMLLAVLGCAVGLLLTLLVAVPINVADISYMPPNASAPVPLQIKLEAAGIVSTLVFLVAVAALSALLPARRAARMQIVDALGHI